ncbi:MAG: hypothetical protein H2172_07725 [Opitutus sp.]|nr:hypothetical protein [Opitutus sp.]MCS6245922.1 hypothetical protein [Opitutus sp.]MCS6272940.1 hypothetical protein [Opitutus sp.]MCS6275999.1 hypothetical protein [Opitutus sp.]MCS6301094.1 hypothetical protein [Opitutus sp.]
MSERLRNLQRQQIILREHLAWIEAEIAQETAPTENVATRPTPWQRTTPEVNEPIDADALIERYAGKERQQPADIRRGCLLLFLGAFALFALLIVGVWWLRYR